MPLALDPLNSSNGGFEVESSTIFGDVTFGACCIDDLGVPATAHHSVIL